MPAAARIDDTTHITRSGFVIAGPCEECESNPVYIEGKRAAHVGCACSQHPSQPFIVGSPSVSIHGKAAVRWTPSKDVGTCGAIVGDADLAASRTVFIGNVGMGGSSCTDGL